MRLYQKGLFGLPLQLFATFAFADYQINMGEGVTAVSRQIYDLHNTIVWICIAIGLVVFGVMFYALFKHRKSKGARPSEFHESTLVEVIWTVIPFLILVAMAIPATKTLFAMYDNNHASLTIKITGYQWKWHYAYLDEDIHFFSNLSTPLDQIKNQKAKGENYLLEVDKPLVLPIHKKIRFVVTSADVIHSWWVPAFGIKRDAIPGFIGEAWTRIDKPGTYRGQCAELCGVNHAFMPIVVVAKTEEDYKTWLTGEKQAKQQALAVGDKTWTLTELLKTGEAVYGTACAVCHQANGEGVPGTFPPMKGGRVATGPVDAHIRMVLGGQPGTAMQAFASQLSDSEIAAVITYERNAWGNNTGDVIQPAAIKAARDKK